MILPRLVGRSVGRPTGSGTTAAWEERTLVTGSKGRTTAALLMG